MIVYLKNDGNISIVMEIWTTINTKVNNNTESI